MCRLEILPTAWKDLERIEDWYAEQFSVEVAIKVIESILNSIENLELFPNLGVFTPDEWLNEQGYRMVICGLHVAIYKIVGGVIYIYHIADTRTDYPSLF